MSTPSTTAARHAAEGAQCQRPTTRAKYCSTPDPVNGWRPRGAPHGLPRQERPCAVPAQPHGRGQWRGVAAKSGS